MNYLLTNFSYGTNPYLRTVEWALSINDRRERKGLERCGIVVPLTDRGQEKIMRQHFAPVENRHPGELLFAPQLGAILQGIFFKDLNFEQFLALWMEVLPDADRQVRDLLSAPFQARTFSGQNREIRRAEILLELTRSPWLSFDVAPALSSSFGHRSLIWHHYYVDDQTHPAPAHLDIPRAISLVEEIERKQKAHFLSVPRSLTGSAIPEMRYGNETEIPPFCKPLARPEGTLDSGIYVNVTGIAGMESLYRKINGWETVLYTNNTTVIPNGRPAPADVLSRPEIRFQYARGGWGSIWNSLLAEKAIVMPAFSAGDDPEIHFNNSVVESLGLGVVHRGESLAELTEKSNALLPRIQKTKTDLLDRFGTLDGIEQAADAAVAILEKIN